jgi:hypothetical protein
MSVNQNPRKIYNDSIIKEITDAIQSIEYGELNIKVHNKRITQIDVPEKKRYNDLWKVEEGGGI